MDFPILPMTIRIIGEKDLFVKVLEIKMLLEFDDGNIYSKKSFI